MIYNGVLDKAHMHVRTSTCARACARMHMESIARASAVYNRSVSQ